MADRNLQPGPTVVVRDRERTLRLRQFDEWDALTLIGAISADPRRMEELEDAWRRYVPDACLEDGSAPLEDAEPNGPWLVVDLACQRLVAGGGEELPEDRSAFQRDEGEWHRDMPVVWINYPPHWPWVSDTDWRHAFPPIPPLTEPLDFRGVLYGRALAAGIAQQTLEVARTEALPAATHFWDDLPYGSPLTDDQRETAGRWHELTIRVHADWLMTPRDDLGGEPPRPFLHRGRDWVEHEMDNRQRQWSNEGQAPRGLRLDSFAFRHGPPGRDEVVIYFELCREVIARAWKEIVAAPDIDETSLTGVLHEHAQRWLKEGKIDGDPTPPAAMIASERQRTPLTGDFNILDHDCPICRLLAEDSHVLSGPMFRGFDGHHLDLDDEFAFSLCETREEWERQQAEYRQMSEAIDAEHAGQSAEEPPGEFDSAWTHSYVAGDTPLTAMTLAFLLAEIVGDLQTVGAHQQHIERLNEAFETCRNAACDPTLLPSAKSHLAGILENIAAEHSELTPKIADFQSRLDEWVRSRNETDLPF